MHSKKSIDRRWIVVGGLITIIIGLSYWLRPTVQLTPKDPRIAALIAEREQVLMRRVSDIEQSCQRVATLLPKIRKQAILAGLTEDDAHNLAAIVLVESRGNTRARSGAGAVGIFQFMRATARGMGMRVSRVKDDRLDPKQSISKAVAMYALAKKQFGHAEFAIWNHHAGSGNVRRILQLAGTGKQTDGYGAFYFFCLDRSNRAASALSRLRDDSAYYPLTVLAAKGLLKLYARDRAAFGRKVAESRQERVTVTAHPWVSR